MALTSPGVQVTVIDESQYIPSAVNTVPYFVIATAQNKVSGTGVGVAAGTLKANANKTYLITSQRDLTATFGVPFFYNTTTGTPINGYELNEYGLLAAYSSLGISNRAYVQRVDIDLTELTASLSRPTGTPNDGTYWLNTSSTIWGIQEWNAITGSFVVRTPLVLNTDTEVDVNNVPLNTIGTIGDYAVVTTTVQNIGYYKNSDNNWVVVGSDDWKMSWPTVTGNNAPDSLTPGNSIYINGVPCTVGVVPTVQGFAETINTAAIPGVTAAATSSNRLALYADSNASNDGSTAGGGIVNIELGTGGAALLTALGITAGQYLVPTYLPGYSYSAPRWGSTQASPRPSGSVWHNMSTANNGLSLKVLKYSTALGTWVAQTTNAYPDFANALYGLDPSGGGKNIGVGTTVALWGANNLATSPNASQAIQIFEKAVFGQTVVTGTTVPTGNAFAPLPGPALQSFTIAASQPGSNVLNTGTAQIASPGTVSDFIAAVSAANVPYVSASVDSAGHIVFAHSAGGVINVTNTIGTPITTAGFTANTTLVTPSPSNASTLQLCNFTSSPAFTYTASDVSPDQNPADGRLWYYSAIDEVDIMIQNDGAWVGYQNVSNDVRGFNLGLTNAAGPIVAATAPTTQTDTAQSPLQYGDLWIDSSDLENYPKMYRWQQVDGVDQWVSMDTADQTTQNGIAFADARWAPNGDTDPVSDPIPTIVSLLTSDYLDLDAPDPTLYPEGMLLWNTRRSGYNVKSFAVNYFSPANFPDATVYPTVTNTWLTASGNKADGSMYSGRLAQREMVVKAMKSGLDTSLGAREETAQYTLIATPAYPEMIPNMIALSNERDNTVFVVGDTPMRLAGNGTDLAAWANNNGGLGFATGDGLAASSQYMGVFYPSATTTDLSGNTVVVPPSHMMIRTIIRSDEVSYPWLAPAGTRRGVVDNATQLGYIDAATGEFIPLSVNQGLRDVLYANAVNPITFVPGIGITNFGNKTATSITSALDRINVARLVAFLRGRLEEIGKLYLFEPNDQITRNEITNTCNSLMVDLVAKRAIYDYLVVCDLSNNTPARIDRNELWVDIAIEPVKAVEFIYIPLRIKNTGEIAAG